MTTMHPSQIEPIAVTVFDAIYPILAEKKQPGSVKAISGLAGVPEPLTREALFWMAEIGWVIRWRRQDGKGAWQYGLPSEEFTPDSSPAPLPVEATYSDDRAVADHGMSIIKGMSGEVLNDEDRRASYDRAKLDEYAYSRRSYNTTMSDRHGRRKGFDVKVGVTIPGRTLEERLEILKKGLAANRARVCSLCPDVFFERDEDQDLCYACEAGMPLSLDQEDALVAGVV